MRIGGFQKLTLLDYPGRMACIVFTMGCNFCCPFCHNAGLLGGQVQEAGRKEEAAAEEEIFTYLKKRQGLLDGLVLTGGEPLLWKDTADFLRKVRALDYSIKLDTNGSFPGRLKGLLDEGLVDYVAMDIKHSREKYPAAAGCGCQGILPAVEESLGILRESGIPFELRTTLVKGIHREEDMEALAAWIAGNQPYYLQNYVDSGNVLQPEGLSSFSPEELSRMLQIARRHCPAAEIRG